MLLSSQNKTTFALIKKCFSSDMPVKQEQKPTPMESKFKIKTKITRCS